MRISLVALKNIFVVIPVWSVALVLGVILFLFTLFKTSLNEKPRFHWVFIELVLYFFQKRFKRFYLAVCISWIFRICGLDLYNCKRNRQCANSKYWHWTFKTCNFDKKGLKWKFYREGFWCYSWHKQYNSWSYIFGVGKQS